MLIYNSLNNVSLTENTAVAVGFFDGMHIGHQKVVETALSYKKQGLKTCVFSFVVGQSSYRKERATHRILSMKDKAEFLRGMGVDYLISPNFDEFKNLMPFEFVRDILYTKLKTKVVCCGSDFRYGKDAAGNVSLLTGDCMNFGIKTEIVDSVNIDDTTASSTVIRGALQSGELELAAKVLGRPYHYTLTVIEGKKLGRKLGFPTINQCFPLDHVKPMDGVYVSVARVRGVDYPAVTSIGKNPTVDGKNIVSETHIIGVNEDLYGEDVTISIYKFLRPQYKFDSIEKLTKQIGKDIEKTKGMFGIK